MRWSPSAPSRGVLGEHAGSAATGVGFRGCSKDTAQRKPNPRFGRQQRAYFSFKTRNLKDWSLITISLHFALSILPPQPPRRPPSCRTPAPPGTPCRGLRDPTGSYSTARDSSTHNAALPLLQHCRLST